ncbi:hypothetical protein EVAR_44135_1 [Eumeta japonica]|uniref:Uncharacterized protein n=1 Tax=Eumeta variegata TaxID=151549 RepID=A0A4C1XM22_EUMVA|nr:hypothetical protein EVAR_44135_1 [Eumeta japonica]
MRFGDTSRRPPKFRCARAAFRPSNLSRLPESEHTRPAAKECPLPTRIHESGSHTGPPAPRRVPETLRNRHDPQSVGHRRRRARPPGRRGGRPPGASPAPAEGGRRNNSASGPGRPVRAD